MTHLSDKRPVLLLLVLLTAVFLLTTLLLATATAENDPDWQAKVDPALLAEATSNNNSNNNEPLSLLVEFGAQADLSRASTLPDKTSRGTFVYDQLTAVARTSQHDVQSWLTSHKLTFRSYAINNSLWVQLPAHLLPALAQRPEVAYLHANRPFPADIPLTTDMAPLHRNVPQAIEWGVARIGAPLVWAEGVTGTAVVVGGQDTGYEWTHPALINQYRGWNTASQTADHNYHWHDAIREDLSGNGSNFRCGFDSAVPCDDNSHGTHTMGTMVGDDGGTNQIGVAPGAQWIGCRNMEEGWGTPQTYIECFDWFLAPTDLAGANPRPDLAPHVINNSWGCPSYEGCNSSNFGLMETAVDNLRAAGVVVVASAGNGGSACGTVNTPAAFFESSFTVGNTMSNDSIAFSSSRGPVTNYGTRLKPEISAPGTSIRSAVLNGGYGVKSGTSMAGPHVAGALALLMAADPDLRGNPDALEALLAENALPLTTSQGCGGDSPTAVPNNVYGHGRVDVFAAYQTLDLSEPEPHQLSLSKTAPLTVSEGMPISYTLTLTHFHPTSPTTNVVLTDVLPLNTTFITATQPFTLEGEMVTWRWATLAPSETVAVQLVVSPTAVTTITNALYGAQDGTVTVQGQAVNTAVFTTTPPLPPPPPPISHTLTLHKSAPTSLMADSWLTYTLVLTHQHPTSPTTNVVLTDTLPLSTTLIHATTPYTQQGDIISWQWETLAPTQTVSVTLTVQPDFAPRPRTLRNALYGASSDQAALVTGPPVLTIVNPYLYYLPLLVDTP